MADEVPKTNGTDPDDFMATLESALRGIVKNRKTSKADKISAIREGVKLLAIKNKINSGDEEGFFK